MGKKDICVIIPMHNEEGNVEALYSRIKEHFNNLKLSWYIIAIDDGSTDKTLFLLQQKALVDPQVKYISLSRNFGHQAALSAGLAFCEADFTVIIDADLQDPPELIGEMYLKAKMGFDVVYAKRKERRGESTLKKWTASLFYRTLKNITEINIPIDTGDFRLISDKVVEVLRTMPERNRFLRGQIAWIGFNQTFVEYDRDARVAGSTSYSYKKMIRLALDGITSFSDVPLRLVTYFGISIAFITFLLTLYALYSRFVIKIYSQGWTSLMLVILFFGAIQMIAVGIIGEYLSRINNDIRQRPLFIVKDSNLGSDIKFEGYKQLAE